MKCTREEWRVIQFTVGEKVFIRVEHWPKAVYKLGRVTRVRRNRMGRIYYTILLDRELTRHFEIKRGRSKPYTRVYKEYEGTLEDMEHLPGVTNNGLSN